MCRRKQCIFRLCESSGKKRENDTKWNLLFPYLLQWTLSRNNEKEKEIQKEEIFPIIFISCLLSPSLLDDFALVGTSQARPITLLHTFFHLVPISLTSAAFSNNNSLATGPFCHLRQWRRFQVNNSWTWIYFLSLTLSLSFSTREGVFIVPASLIFMALWFCMFYTLTFSTSSFFSASSNKNFHCWFILDDFFFLVFSFFLYLCRTKENGKNSIFCFVIIRYNQITSDTRVSEKERERKCTRSKIWWNDDDFLAFLFFCRHKELKTNKRWRWQKDTDELSTTRKTIPRVVFVR